MNNSNLHQKLITSIMSTNCNILDISYRYGNTYYIDFIKKSELDENVIMRGIDDFKRRFIVFKAEITYLKLGKQTSATVTLSTFTTFFQRYADDSLLWHSCGHDGPLLFNTDGGINITQLKLLDDLLKNGFVDLTPDINYEELRLYSNNSELLKPIKIQLGYTV